MASVKIEPNRKFKLEPIDYEFKWISENPEAARRKYLLERNVKQLYTARVQLETSTTQTDKIIRIG